MICCPLKHPTPYTLGMKSCNNLLGIVFGRKFRHQLRAPTGTSSLHTMLVHYPCERHEATSHLSIKSVCSSNQHPLLLGLHACSRFAKWQDVRSSPHNTLFSVPSLLYWSDCCGCNRWCCVWAACSGLRRSPNPFATTPWTPTARGAPLICWM